jgi:hypothetical protein
MRIELPLGPGRVTLAADADPRSLFTLGIDPFSEGWEVHVKGATLGQVAWVADAIEAAAADPEADPVTAVIGDGVVEVARNDEGRISVAVILHDGDSGEFAAATHGTADEAVPAADALRYLSRQAAYLEPRPYRAR